MPAFHGHRARGSRIGNIRSLGQDLLGVGSLAGGEPHGLILDDCRTWASKTQDTRPEHDGLGPVMGHEKNGGRPAVPQLDQHLAQGP